MRTSLMTTFTTPESRWAAVSSRDPRASGAFVYSVTTTKIYCRPACPSRLARRSNVVFHDTAADAKAAGFRPCKRCLPNAIDTEKDPQVIAAEKACRLIREESGRKEKQKWSVRALGIEVGLTESHFCRVFKKVTGMTVGEYRSSLGESPTELACLESRFCQNHETLSTQDTLKSFPSIEEWESAKTLESLDASTDWLELDSNDLYSSYATEDADFSISCTTPLTATFLPSDLSNADLDDCFQFADFSSAFT